MENKTKRSSFKKKKKARKDKKKRPDSVPRLGPHAGWLYLTMDMEEEKVVPTGDAKMRRGAACFLFQTFSTHRTPQKS